MPTSASIFKAYDLRGIYGADLDEDTAYKLGLAFAYLRKEELPDNKTITITVGADMRISSPSLKAKLIDGLLDGGVDVVDIGLSSTPTFYFAVAHFDYDGGILVSASHNPKEYNGFKIVRNKALPVSKESGIMQLKEMVINGNLQASGTRGSLHSRDNALSEQVKHDLAYADLGNIKQMKIVIDPANAMGAQYFDALFSHLPGEIVRMNWDLDGNFPAHEADPFKPENILPLCDRVKQEKADLGIATDGDGDRIFFVDDKGEAVEPGITRAILCRIFLRENPGAKICYDIRPGRITEDTIKENGGVPIVTRVGHSLIKEKAISEGAVFAGESSGHFFLNMAEGCYEVPLIVTLKMLEELSRSGKTFSEYIAPFKRYAHSGEINSLVDDVQKKIEQIKEKYANGQVDTLDGVTVFYDDYWFNVRGSNTEPLLRLNLEAKNEKVMAEKRDEILAFIRS